MGGKREMPAAAQAFTKLAAHIRAEMNATFPVSLKLAKIYNDEAKSSGSDPIKLFDNDSKEQRNKKHELAKRQAAERKSKK